MNIIPTVIEKDSNKEYAYDLYSRLLNDRIVFLNGEINDNVASIVVSELLYLDSLNHNDIYLYINSPGGSVTSGMAIYDTMNYVKSDVRTICLGVAASMGAFLLANGTKGKRCSLPNAEIMIHQPLGGSQGQASDMEIAAKRILKTRDKLNKIFAKVTGKELEVIEKDTDRDNFMDPEDALEYGLIDEIIKNTTPL